MSFLTPLYIAGALAIALPILFHLLRRAPQSRQTFSSLMFLAPTPPRFTRKSKISNWLLLLLRAAALILLAIAFARPFLREDMAIASDGTPGRRIAILIDTSASMRRDDLWSEAKRQAETVLNGVTPADAVSLYFFDRGVRPAFTFEQWNRLDPAQRIAAVRAEMNAAQPTWESTSIGDAVARVAEQLAAVAEKGGAAAGPGTVILISDLQQGGRAEALQGRAWPDSVRLDVRPVAAKSNANAGLQIVRAQPDSPDAADVRPRVRVSNSAGSDVDQFDIAWADANGVAASAGKAHKAYAPAGRGQVVRVDWPTQGSTADRIVLGGDAADFDNTLFVARPRQGTARVVFAGNDAADDPQGLAFYLRTAFGDTPQRRVEVATADVAKLSTTDVAGAGLVVVGRPMDDASAATLRQYLEAGGDALWVLRDKAAAEGLAKAAGLPSIGVEESTTAGFALVSRLDTSHPLLAAFADARFGDFGRVHFWKYRTLTLPADSGAKVLAAFDNGDAFLVEKIVGRGRLFVMTSGWQPADSQLALSAKFVPILDGLLRPRDGGLVETQYVVGDTLRTPAAGEKPWTATTPDGRTISLAAGSADVFDRPGIFTINTAAGPVPVAVNLRPDESRTTPITPADFKQWGAKLASDETAAVSPDGQRQAQRAELENRQKLWQWLLLGVLGLVAAETALAGRLAKRAGPIESSTANG